MVVIESFVAFIHRIAIYKVLIYIIIIVVINYCSVVYPVAVGGGAARGGTAEHDGGAGARCARAALDLLQRRRLPLPLLSPLDHRDQEQNQPAQRYRAASYVKAWRVRVECVVQPTCKWRSYKRSNSLE